MARNVVADFTGFLSVTSGDDQLFQDHEGRVVMSRRSLVFAGEGDKQKLPLESVAAFDFRTVPPEWEQFFDDLVGVRFDHEDEEYTVTVGTDTQTADRFVTVLLKILLDDTEITLTQKSHPLADGTGEQTTATTQFTLLPKSERINFDDDAAHSIDISTVTGVTPKEDGGVVVRHLDENGRIFTKLTPETDRGAQFLRTYIDFRAELSAGGGPVQFLFVGEDRDALVLIAKLLKHRDLEFEITHAETVAEAGEALRTAEEPMECAVCEFGLAATLLEEFEDRPLPVVLFSRETPETPTPESDHIVETVTLDSRTAHYEDIADAVERAVLEARVDS